LLQVQYQLTAVNCGAPTNGEIVVAKNNYNTPWCIQLTRTQWEVTSQWYLSNTITLHKQSAAMEDSHSGNTFRLAFRRIPTHCDNHPCSTKMHAVHQLTPLESFMVEGITYLSIQSRMPTIVQSPMPCTGHLAAIRKYYQLWTSIQRPRNERIPHWSCGTMLTASLTVYQDSNSVSQWLALEAHK